MYLLLDIGGTKTRIALAKKHDHKINRIKTIPTIPNFEKAIEKIYSLANELLEQGEEISTVSAGVATPLDKEKSKITFHSNKEVFFDWVEKPLKEKLEKTFNCPVFIENDAAFGALGEASFGAGRGKQVVAFLTISTGVGGARIVNQKIDESSLGFEPGWQIVDASGSLCPECKQAPLHLGIINGENIKKRTGKMASEVTNEEFWNEVAKILAFGLYNTIMLWSPDIIVLGGSVSKNIPIEETKAQLTKIPSPFNNIPEIRRGLLGGENGVYGALQYLKTKI